MPPTIDQAFIKQYEAEVHEAYQQRGSKARGTVRLKTGVVGESTTFQKVGKGIANNKTRHGDVTPMNVDHTPMECTFADWYAPDYIDKLDELKTNIDERMVVVNSGAFALGRKVDSLLFAAARSGLAAAQKVAVGAAGLTRKKILEAFEILHKKDVPFDGNVFAFVGAHQWLELLNISEFKDADFVGPNELPWIKGPEAKMWLGAFWQMSTELTLSGGNRYCLIWHRNAMGWGENISGVWTDLSWVPQKAAWLADNAIAGGAVRIDDEGVVELPCDDDAAFT